MTWVFPERLPRNALVADPDGLEDGLRDIESVLGGLGEHNFDSVLASELTRADNLADDVAYRAAFTYVAGANIDGCTDGTPNSAEVVVTVTSWYSVPSTETTFTTEGGVFFVAAGGGYYTDSDTSDSTSVRYAIMVDGNVVPETITGDIDDAEEPPHMERGLGGYRGGLDILAFIPLSPGRHTVSLACNVLAYRGITTGSPLLALHGRPFLVKELGR